MNIPVFDFHCDTAMSMMRKSLRGDVSLMKNDGHIDLERAKTLPGYCQCFACYTSTWDNVPGGLKVEDVFERQLNLIQRELHRHADEISLVYTAQDIRDNLKNGKMSCVLTIEGPAGFGFDPELLECLYLAGFRFSTLGWNENNVLTGSHVTGGGLTDLGRTYVREAQRLGIGVDVSHISDEGFWDIMKITQKPIIASHSNSRAVWDVSRNLTDDMFRAICQTGGAAGFNLYAQFIGNQPDLDNACDHILHFLELDPEGRHIALGGDLDGCDSLPAGFDGIQDYPKLAQRLLERGVDETLIRRIYWENALEVMERCST